MLVFFNHFKREGDMFKWFNWKRQSDNKDESKKEEEKIKKKKLVKKKKIA